MSDLNLKYIPPHLIYAQVGTATVKIQLFLSAIHHFFNKLTYICPTTLFYFLRPIFEDYIKMTSIFHDLIICRTVIKKYAE